MTNPIGWHHNESAPQASPEILETLRGLAVSLLSDNMARASGTIGLQPYHRPKPMAGTAVTVEPSSTSTWPEGSDASGRAVAPTLAAMIAALAAVPAP